MVPGVEVEIQASGELQIPIDPGRIERAVRFVLTEEGVGAASVSITFLSDAEIAGMNHAYLSHDGPTDIISFPLGIPGGAPVGDIYIGVEEAARQAVENAVSMEEEVLRLAIHGTLHILGFGHPEGDGRLESSMYVRQEALLARVMGEGTGA
jgi:probable rRNA maturation factor